MPLHAFLDNLAQIHPISADVKEQFFAKLRLLKLPKGKILLSEGETCEKLWFVSSGLVRGYYGSHDPKHGYQEITEWFATEENFFFAAESFIQNVPSSETIELLEDSELVYITRNDLYDFYSSVPEVCNLGRIMAERYWLLQKERLRDMRLHSAEERLQIFQLKSKHLFLRVHQRYIASFLGISENYVSKLKAKRG